MDSASARERFGQLLGQLDDGRVGPWQYQVERDQPVIVLEETEEAYVVAFDMTAYDADSVSADLEDRTLVLTADRIERTVVAVSQRQRNPPADSVVGRDDAIRHSRRSRSPFPSSSPAST